MPLRESIARVYCIPLTVNNLSSPHRFLLFCGVALFVACGESSTVPEYGDPCTGSCPTLLCVEDLPGGLCTETCEDGECGTGGTCDDRFGLPLCLLACEAGSECREGWSCWREACQPACTTDPECGAEAVCRDGVCEGAECTTDDECPAGTCSAGTCVGLADMGPPPECEDTCEGVCLGEEYGGGCAPSCTDSPSCGSGFNCAPVPSDTNGDGRVDRIDPACIPFNPTGRFTGGTCSGSQGGTAMCDSRVCFENQCAIACDDDTDCLLGQTCQDRPWDDATVRTCYDDPALAGGGDLELRAGRLTSGFPTQAIFAAPRNATSMVLLLEQTDGADLPFTFVSVIDPTETVLFDLDGIAELEDQPIRWLPLNTYEAAAMLVPNTTADRVTFRGGRHRVSYAAFTSETGDTVAGNARLVARFATGSGATLRLRLHFAPGLGVSASTAPGTSRVQNAIAAMAATYAAAGITVQVEGYADVSGSNFTVIDSTDGPSSELYQLFSRGTGSGDVLDVFFVRSIDSDGGGGTTLGIAGGIPGPPSVHGKLTAGVVAAYDSGVVGSATNLGQILAHESGHYLGLFHSTENGRPCSAGETDGCAPFGGGDPIADTTRGDNRNMMFWALQTFGGGTVNNRITAGQGFVLQRNPLVTR